ncbi:hypothetical protein TOPH_02545 [Tolypocladium ophioglossoides CBS 100239]|uniref:Septin-type G domain-containing protein n=1 Tax=Tolypocladium ophioglossoides (strain CBS 100239) TaxID=1163406 RepID=A0A0L0NF18_TOLOC|nr:hypothetical protein TOPH_02545 [Tolypocladium ophioglossoides CBS 100239]
MRPVPTPADASGNRRADPDVLSLNTPVAPLSCFIATEADLDSALDSSELEPRARSRIFKRSRSSSPSLSDLAGHRLRQASPSLSSDMDLGISQPMTPVFTRTFGPGSAVSVPSPPGNASSISLSEEPGSIAASFAELSPSRSPHQRPVASVAGSTVPQLVMPSLTVPRRRPFSEVGKSLGKLKLLIAGQAATLLIDGAGIGKTSLILSIAQCCDHIVHMDSVNQFTAHEVAEVHASSRPHPWWRADLDPATYIKRRRRSSTTDEILDRNLCFASQPVLQYVESELLRLSDKPIEDADLYALLSGGGESTVDGVLYMFPHTGPDLADIQCIKSLQGMTNIIPLLARADELTDEEIRLSKDRIRQSLGDEYLECFSFANPESARELELPKIYAVSSATQLDRDTIDASILMSSEYLQPLVTTELGELVHHIFSLDGSSWLRHSAAVKSVNWRQRRLRHSTSRSALACRCLTSHGVLVPYAMTNPYIERRCWGRIELSSWAEGLRESLASERFDRSQQFLGPEIARHEMPLAKTTRQHQRQSRHPVAQPINTNHEDPLGLLELASQIKHGGGITLELLSSLGVLGCLAAWLIRPELAHHWDVRLPPAWCLTTC